MNQHENYEIGEVTEKIRQWAHDRNLIDGATSASQFLKLTEEWKEIFDGIFDKNIELIIDAVGDCYVVLTIIAAQNKIDLETLNYTPAPFENAGISVLGALAHNIAKGKLIIQPLTECLCYLAYIADGLGFSVTYAANAAYHEIKDRKGRVVDGVFVKEADLPT